MSLEIVSIIRDSFQEFEDKWSLVVFCKGCNLKCPECYNLGCNSFSETISIDYILKNEINQAHEAIVFLGGEPTIWDKDLSKALKASKKIGLDTKVFSNGILPKVVSDLNNEKLVDAYSLDLKAVRNVNNVVGVQMTDSDYLKKVCDSINNILEYGLNLEIRTTKWDCIIDQVDEIKDFMIREYPEIKHIIQEKFEINE